WTRPARIWTSRFGRATFAPWRAPGRRCWGCRDRSRGYGYDMRRKKAGRAVDQGLGRARMGRPGRPARRRNNGHRFGPLSTLAWVQAPEWRSNPRWWHHADRVFGYILVFLVVFWALFDRYLEVFLVI